MPPAQLHHAPFRAAVQHRVLHLVGHDRHACAQYLFQTRDVKVGQADVPDFSGPSQVVQAQSRLHIAWRAIVPPVELDQVQPFQAQSPERPVYRRLHVGPGQGPQAVQVGHILGVDLYSGQCVPVAPEKVADQRFDPCIDISAVEGSDAGLDAPEHVIKRLFAIDGSVTTGKLPPAFDQAGYRILWSKKEAPAHAIRVHDCPGSRELANSPLDMAGLCTHQRTKTAMRTMGHTSVVAPVSPALTADNRSLS